MQSTLRINLLCIAIFTMAFGCNDQSEPVSDSLPVTFTYELLDSSGKPSVVFQQGDAIFFRFSVHNSTDQNVSLSNYLDRLAADETGSFSVDQKIYSDIGEEKWTRIGRACFPAPMYSIGAIIIGSKKNYPFQVEWLQTEGGCRARNQSLPKGQYRSQFSYDFTGAPGSPNDGQHSTQNFSISFLVQ